MQRPTALYPAPPKAEWFMRHTSTLQHLGDVGDMDELKAAQLTSFLKMTQDNYNEYLQAHELWLETVSAVDKRIHDAAVAKRHLDKFRIVSAGFVDPDDPTEVLTAPAERHVTSNTGVTVIAVSELKKEHAPSVSVKPHKDEVRKAKKSLSAARTETKAHLLKKKVALEKSSRPEKERVLEEVAAIKTEAPLRAVELAAANHAAKRAQAITRGSKDLVANVDPDNKWKVVTRKKGDKLAINSFVAKFDASHKHLETYQFASDPSMSKTASVINAVRAPQSTSAR